ncbi:MAG: hypothetical protein M3126_01575 [Candidatus Eremiobacteraeota bacterium]|nr:hypothetical protein [Candidatus Eremiobacteraeota bacterium]
MFKRALSALVLMLLLCAPALADDATQGFTAHGTIVAQVVFSGTKINLGGDINMQTRGQQLRFDILRLSVPGTEATLNALLSQFLPQGGVSAVMDQSTGNTTVWSDARRKYYVFAGNKTASTGVPGASAASAVPGAAGSIMQLLESGKFVKGYTQFSETINMSGRSTVNGHPATNLHIAFRAQKAGAKLTDYVGDLSLAEDAQYLPVRIAATDRASKMSANINFTSLTATAPDPSVFVIPSGYAQASDPSEVFGAGIPHP